MKDINNNRRNKGYRYKNVHTMIPMFGISLDLLISFLVGCVCYYLRPGSNDKSFKILKTSFHAKLSLIIYIGSIHLLRFNATQGIRINDTL